MSHTRTNTGWPLFGTLVLLYLLAGCSSNPATGGRDVTIMSGGREIQVGREMHDELVSQGAAYNDPALQAYVSRIGQHLVDNSDAPQQSFTFTVLDSPDINAFATPGGFIYVNRGLLAYLDSEAELAGVLAHEIAHVTARHAARQQSGRVTNQVLAATAYILTGSGDLADASAMYGQELISGYGREHELEADSLGARYMHNAGYDAEALLSVIAVLKDQEQYQRVKARSSGRRVASYHGLYATHPRNDRRLQEVIRAASELDHDTRAPDPVNPGEFSEQLEGLVWGASIQGEQETNRYYHQKLGFSFAHPPGWSVSAGSRAIIASSGDGAASMTLSVDRRDASTDVEAALRQRARGTLSAARPLNPAGLPAFTAIASTDSQNKRLAVIDFRGLYYLFEGSAANFAERDPQLLACIESFRPILPSEQLAGPGLQLHYIQVPRGATLESIAASIHLPDAEATLRLLNGLYPRGEPRTGDWIKVIRPAPS